MRYEIKHWRGHVLFAGEHETLIEALRAALASGAVLSGAVLRDADLSGADLSGADLSGADLSGAVLRVADLSDAEQDLWKVLDAAPDEVEGLVQALREGRVDGSAYEGACACLVGTIANVRVCHYAQILGLEPDANRPAERWFLGICPGMPPTHARVAITLDWIERWGAVRGVEAFARALGKGAGE